MQYQQIESWNKSTSYKLENSEPTKHWFSGPYKITYYEGHENENVIVKPSYRAYFKPIGWKNWGMGCEKRNPAYATLEQAKAACVRHAEIGDYIYRGE